MLTDAQVAEIKVRAESRRSFERSKGAPSASRYDLDEIDRLLSDRDELVRRLAKVGEWAHPDGIDRECYLCGETHGNGAPTDATCPCPAHDAAPVSPRWPAEVMEAVAVLDKYVVIAYADVAAIVEAHVVLQAAGLLEGYDA